MLKLPKDPYSTVPTKERVKLQSYVTGNHKDRLMLVCPDRNLYTLLINHALRRAVEFIDTHNLAYNPVDQQRLIDFIVTGADAYGSVATAEDGLRQHTTPCAPRDAVSRNVTGGPAELPAAHQDPANLVPVVLEKPTAGRQRKGGKGKKS